jgi:nicotinamide-nucleotide amidase
MITSIEQLAKQVGDQLKSRNLKLVTAESCTGGGLAYAITSIPGSSAWFDRGLVTYSNTSKEELLGVSPLTLATFGSVSAETAQEMAEGALNRSEAQISIALTGIAGPDGGTPDKPVGTVWIACAANTLDTQVIHHLFSGERAMIREKSIEAALRILLELSFSA